MEELQLAFSLPVVEQKKLGLWVKSWRLGEVMQARLIDKTSSGNLILQFPGYRIRATADVAVHKGALLSLEVSGLYPVPRMKIINAPTQAAVQSNLLHGQLPSLLSRHGAVIAPFLTLLDPAQRVKFLSLLGVKNGVLDSFYNNVGQFEAPTNPGILRKAFLQSGLFLESELFNLVAAGGLLSHTDIKATLFRLLHTVNRGLRRPPAAIAGSAAEKVLLNLQAELEGALATITLNQLLTCQMSERDGCIWLFDRPFRVRDSLCNLGISIKQEGTASPDQPELQDWKVLMSVTLPALGAIESELFLRGRKVSVVVYAPGERSIRLLNERLPQLRAGLENTGLEISVLRSHQGSHPEGGTKALWRQCLDETIRKEKSRRLLEGPKGSDESAGSVAATHDDDVVAKIQALAVRDGIPLSQDVTLTGLLGKVPGGDGVPETLFMAMAEVLSFLHCVDGSDDYPGNYLFLGWEK